MVMSMSSPSFIFPALSPSILTQTEPTGSYPDILIPAVFSLPSLLAQVAHIQPSFWLTFFPLPSLAFSCALGKPHSAFILILPAPKQPNVAAEYDIFTFMTVGLRWTLNAMQ